MHTQPVTRTSRYVDHVVTSKERSGITLKPTGPGVGRVWFEIPVSDEERVEFWRFRLTGRIGECGRSNIATGVRCWRRRRR